jgi:hypothetical protein
LLGQLRLCDVLVEFNRAQYTKIGYFFWGHGVWGLV